MIDAIANVLASILRAFYGVSGSYLAAIVLLTVAIKAILHPLTRKQLQSMKAMQALTPQMEALRRKYRDDPRQLNAEIMRLYASNKVNPFGGCLPLLAQLPILWGLFALLRRPGVFGGERLFGVSLEQTLTPGGPWDFAGMLALIAAHPPLALIPILTAVTTYYQQQMSITDPQQARMFIFMPVLVALFSVQFPIGLSIYWIISTAVYIFEYFLVIGRPRRVVVPARSGAPAQRRTGQTKT